MTNYIRVKWIHSIHNEPVLIYSELDEERWELRKVEIYADGRMGFACKSESAGGSGLSKEPIPSLDEIANDDQFQPIEIDRDEFERIWNSARSKS
ncbi:DUF6881 domain-containing protein [Burkholderia vietnamiensis]|uniref:DUF6881 domain-containing protein n=1 Tax=Burkholderia vietnamiensis TaxID=60552 RepID=UPI001B9EAE95|nr:hypothetical protein [Burkholderia vietnamiensis]MBR8216273.1 hypothetical protein [Burkholderia vietnamiensis]